MSNGINSILDYHGQALNLRAQRQTVLAGNIANGDTPGFKARDFDFAAELSRATGAQATEGGAAPANGTAPLPVGASSEPARAGHLALTGGSGAVRSAGDPRMLYRQPEQAAIDGNTVELDRERAAFADNTVRYEATLRFINGHVRTMLSAIKGE
ncbi:MAG: flagellar basal body rod protein FlgB [Burkholderiaceae bacterium]